MCQKLTHEKLMYYAMIYISHYHIFSTEESKDRALQQRVRRLHSKLEKGIVNADTLLDIEKEFEEYIPLAQRACDFLTKSTDPFLAVKECSDVLDEAGFVKLSKREPFGGKLIPGELMLSLFF